MKGNCEICNTEIEIHMCCSGTDCGCLGMPTEMPVCSNECEKAWIEKRKNTKPAKPQLKEANLKIE